MNQLRVFFFENTAHPVNTVRYIIKGKGFPGPVAKAAVLKSKYLRIIRMSHLFFARTNIFCNNMAFQASITIVQAVAYTMLLGW